jgi:hypothetical protein
LLKVLLGVCSNLLSEVKTHHSSSVAFYEMLLWSAPLMIKVLQMDFSEAENYCSVTLLSTS